MPSAGAGSPRAPVSATASDAQGIDKVQFVKSGGDLIGADHTPPYALQWTVSPGVTWIKARAFDHCGNSKVDRNNISVVN